MSRILPPALRPLWPFFKRAHRVATFILGVAHRRLFPFLGARAVPRCAYPTSAAAAAAERSRIVRHPAGEAYRMTRKVPPGDAAGRAVFAQGAHVEIDERYVLEVDEGRIVGDFGALVTPGGRLDYETSNYFGLAGWREHPIFLRATTGATRRVAGRVLSLMAPGVATNYYHFLYDAIGRLQVVEASGVDAHFDAVIVPHSSGYQRQLLEWVGITVPLVQPARHESVVADRLVVPSTPNSRGIAPRETVFWLREKFLPAVLPPPSERIFITRGQQAGNRRYDQEDALWPMLEERGFCRVDPGSLSVRDQVDLFSRATMVVSPHGAGLTNVTFAPPGVQVLELFAPRYVHLGLWTICESLGHVTYRYLVGDGRPGSLPRPFDDISLAPARVIDVVDQMIADEGAMSKGSQP